MPETQRLFIAAPLPLELSQRLGAIQRELQQAHGHAMRWEPVARMHLTVRFLGATAADLEGRIATAMQDATDAFPPVALALGAISGFPDRRQPRVVAATPGGQVDRLLLLRRRLDDALARIGINPDTGRFTPHVTIGRVRRETSRRDRTRLGTTLATVPTPADSWSLDTIVLFRSELHPEGARHISVTAVRLAS